MVALGATTGLELTLTPELVDNLAVGAALACEAVAASESPAALRAVLAAPGSMLSGSGAAALLHNSTGMALDYWVDVPMFSGPLSAPPGA